jgi:hypothetical protein
LIVTVLVRRKRYETVTIMMHRADSSHIARLEKTPSGLRQAQIGQPHTTMPDSRFRACRMAAYSRPGKRLSMITAEVPAFSLVFPS